MAHGVVPGLHCYEGEAARRAVEQGFGMVTVAVELRTLRAAIAQELGQARKGTLPAKTAPVPAAPGGTQ